MNKESASYTDQSSLIRVLLIEDNPGDARLIWEMLSEAKDFRFDLAYAEQLSTGLKYLSEQKVNVLLLDLSLPDSLGLDTFTKARAQITTLPIIVLSGLDDETLAIKAVRQGAQDYLVKGRFDSDLLIRSIHYAIERKKVEDELKKYHNYLEKLVEERTAKLTVTNQHLQQEIIERKKAEEATAQAYAELKQIFNAAADGMCVIDKDFKVIRVNETLCNLIGINQEEVIGKNCHELFHHSLCDNLTCSMHSFSEGEERFEYDIEIDGPHNLKIPCILTVIPFRGKDGQLIGVVENFKDITERRKMEEELSKAQKLESLGVLAGGIAHDFNNLLTAINGSFALAKRYLNPSDRAFEILSKAEKMGLRAKDLTKQLLTFSKGGAPIRKPVTIKALLEHSTSVCSNVSGLKYEFSLSEDIWPVEIDEGQINQAINNLLMNADQAMPQGGTIKIEAENKEIRPKDGLPLEEGRYVKISLKDQGVGIQAQDLIKIFDPYFTTNKKRSGLGLTIAYSIIKNHGGYLAAESIVDVGSTFSIYLPASQQEVQELEKKEEDFLFGHGKILLMDDEQIVRQMLGQILNYLGYEVALTVNGEEAIELYKKEKNLGCPFKAVILDLIVPGGLGGKETIRKLLEIDPEIKAIVSSGYSNDPVMANYREYGFQGVLEKPFTIEELSETLITVLSVCPKK